MHALRGALRFPFVVVALDEPGQRDDAVLDGYRDVGRVDVRVPLELFLDVPFDLAIGPHDPSLSVFAQLAEDSKLIPTPPPAGAAQAMSKTTWERPHPV